MIIITPTTKWLLPCFFPLLSRGLLLSPSPLGDSASCFWEQNLVCPHRASPQGADAWGGSMGMKSQTLSPSLPKSAIAHFSSNNTSRLWLMQNLLMYVTKIFVWAWSIWTVKSLLVQHLLRWLDTWWTWFWYLSSLDPALLSCYQMLFVLVLVSGAYGESPGPSTADGVLYRWQDPL